MAKTGTKSTIRPTHGGKRKGAGRPKTKEPTKAIRVPISLVEEVKSLIGRLRKEK